jgi:hypothetical protein
MVFAWVFNPAIIMPTVTLEFSNTPGSGRLEDSNKRILINITLNYSNNRSSLDGVNERNLIRGNKLNQAN